MKPLTRAAAVVVAALALSAARAEACCGYAAFAYVPCSTCGYGGYGYGYGGYGYGYGVYPALNAYYPAAYSPYLYYLPPAVAGPVAYPYYPAAGYTYAYVPGVPGSSAANYYSLYPPAGYYPYATVGYYGYAPALYQPYPPVYYYTSANLAVIPAYPAAVVDPAALYLRGTSTQSAPKVTDVPRKMEPVPPNPAPSTTVTPPKVVR